MAEKEYRRISVGIYKPAEGRGIEEVVKHVGAVTATLPLTRLTRALTLRHVDDAWLALVCVWNVATFHFNPPAEVASRGREVVKDMEWRWFDLHCEQRSEGEGGEMDLTRVNVGDVVSVRRIYARRRDEEKVAYTCLAVLKAYFRDTKGLNWCAFFTCLEGHRFVGFGVWDSVETAQALGGGANPAEAFWRSVGAKILKYDVTRVLGATSP